MASFPDDILIVIFAIADLYAGHVSLISKQCYDLTHSTQYFQYNFTLNNRRSLYFVVQRAINSWKPNGYDLDKYSCLDKYMKYLISPPKMGDVSVWDNLCYHRVHVDLYLYLRSKGITPWIPIYRTAEVNNLALTNFLLKTSTYLRSEFSSIISYVRYPSPELVDLLFSYKINMEMYLSRGCRIGEIDSNVKYYEYASKNHLKEIRKTIWDHITTHRSSYMEHYFYDICLSCILAKTDLGQAIWTKLFEFRFAFEECLVCDIVKHNLPINPNKLTPENRFLYRVLCDHSIFHVDGFADLFIQFHTPCQTFRFLFKEHDKEYMSDPIFDNAIITRGLITKCLGYLYRLERVDLLTEILNICQKRNKAFYLWLDQRDLNHRKLDSPELFKLIAWRYVYRGDDMKERGDLSCRYRNSCIPEDTYEYCQYKMALNEAQFNDNFTYIVNIVKIYNNMTQLTESLNDTPWVLTRIAKLL